MFGLAVGRLMKLANREPTRLAIEALDIRPGNDVLDLGCGPGQAAAQMVSLASPGRVYGIDQSATMIATARRTYRDAEFRQASFDALPFADGSFDRILASNVMYFWHDTAMVLAEIRRVLRQGGKLAIYLTSGETMRHWRIAHAGTHRLFQLKDVQDVLTIAGFSPDRISLNEVRLNGGVTGIIAVAERD
jgi:ubiquinone/menaquinone biosynthesis C-methylase UbiE